MTITELDEIEDPKKQDELRERVEKNEKFTDMCDYIEKLDVDLDELTVSYYSGPEFYLVIYETMINSSDKLKLTCELSFRVSDTFSLKIEETL